MRKAIHPLGKILLNGFLAGIWALSFAALFYNAVEDRVLDLHVAGYVGLGVLIAVLIQTISSIRFAFLSFRDKQFGKMTVYLLLSGILLLIARMGAWVTWFHFVGVVGGH